MFLLKEYSTFEYKKDLDQEGKQKKSKYGNMLVTGVLQRADTLNANGRIYPKNILEREIENYKKLVRERRATGTLDHENEPVVELKNVSHVITEVWWEGDVVKGTVEILENMDQGRQLKVLFENDIKVGISSRGLGSVETKNNKDIVQDDFTLICWDFVSEPSTPGAFMSPVNENIIKKIFTKEDRINRIANEILNLKGRK